MRPTLTRIVAPVAFAALALTAPAAAQAAAPPASTDAQATSWAANFIATTLKAGGDHYDYPPSDYGTFADVGNTIDAVLALDAAGEGGDQVAATMAWIEAQAAGYAAWDGKTYGTGSLGKLAILADAQGLDPTDFGTVDLVGQLTALETDEGRFGTQDNDYDVTLNQALAMIGLARNGVGVSDAAIGYLLAQQCDDGGFRGSLAADTCVSDPDATAFSAQALLAVSADAAAEDALDHLASKQAADGSLTNATGEGPNTNTTGVASQAFIAGGRTDNAARANAYIRSLQWGCEVPAEYRGGLAFTPGTRSIGDDAKVNAANLASALRATTQATQALAGHSLLSIEAGGLKPGTVAMTCSTSSPSPTASTPSATASATASSTPSATATSTAVPTTAAATTEAAPTATHPDKAFVAADRAALARTGSNLGLPLLIGLGLVLAGLVLLVLRRRGARA